MNLFHDSRNPNYRSPYGAVPTGQNVTLCLDASVPDKGRVLLRLWNGKETLLPMDRVEGNRFQITIPMPETPGLLWYYFRVETGTETLCYGHPADALDGVGAVSEDPQSWQITVYVPTALPDWYRNAVVYQIFPDRFARGADWEVCQKNAAHPAGWKNSKRLVVQDWEDTPFYCRDDKGRVTRWPFFGGNLRGIQEKLPYLKDLGVGAIYLNPIFLASSNHKYDTADYLKIDPSFGDESEFSALCAAARDMGIRVILDGVFSHTGDDSVYFNRWGNFPQPGAYSAEKSPYDSWYRFGPEHPSGYECWWGVDALPDVEETDPGFVEYICGENGVIRKWLRLGASGWRLDVADELPDCFIAAIRRAVKAEKPDGLLMGEVWEDASHKISYGQLREYFLGQELDCTMHYPFRVGAIDFMLGRIDGSRFAAQLEALRENYPPSALFGAMNLLGTHDTPRILTILGEAQEPGSEVEREHFRLPDDRRALAIQRLKALDLLLFTAPGVPCVYYGDEAGMEGFADPFNRGPFPWGREERALQDHVKALAGLRKAYPVLTEGAASYEAPSAAVFGIRRALGAEVVLCYVNRSGREEPVCLPEGAWRELLSGETFAGTLVLPPVSGVILHQKGRP